MAKLYLLLGGNLGDKETIFSEVKRLLKEKVGEITARSNIYETEPWGFESEDMFWNQAIEISTSLSPVEVLHETQQIEAELGRIRISNHYDSRMIDIDILFYDNQIIELENLTVPHPRILERKFVLMPLAEIAQTFIHPIFLKTIGQLMLECTDNLRVEKIKNNQKE